MKQRIGIIEIRNLLTDYCIYLSSDDTFNDCAHQRFLLDLGMHPCKSLQEDYTSTGLELFEIHEVELLGSETEKQTALEKHIKGCSHLYR